MTKSKNIYKKYADKHQEIDGVVHKWCLDCDKWFSMDEKNFKVQPSKKDGFSDRCRTCQEKYNHEHYMADRDHQIEMAKKRSLENHEELLPYWRQYYFDNIDRKREINQNWMQNNKEERLQYMDNYRKTEAFKQSMKRSQKNRILHKKHEISYTEWIACKNYFGNCCAYCGLPISQNFRIFYGELQQTDLNKDHYINDGSNDLTNCIPACWDCNNSKKKKDIHIWYNENNPIFSKARLEKIFKWLTEDCYQYIEEKKPRAPYGSKKKVK